MIHHRIIDIRLLEIRLEFHFNLPFNNKWRKLVFSYPVTFFIGENVSGKSTFENATLSRDILNN
jgi:predicted ATPase